MGGQRPVGVPASHRFRRAPGLDFGERVLSLFARWRHDLAEMDALGAAKLLLMRGEIRLQVGWRGLELRIRPQDASTTARGLASGRTRARSTANRRSRRSSRNWSNMCESTTASRV
jgi:hypothetical protein